jgi:hypothetical protein
MSPLASSPLVVSLGAMVVVLLVGMMRACRFKVCADGFYNALFLQVDNTGDDDYGPAALESWQFY